MKLLLVFLLITFFTTIWAYQPRHTYANWITSFDRSGWSECPNNFYVNGMYRSANTAGVNGLNKLEYARCTQASMPGAQTCEIGNWRTSFDNKGKNLKMVWGAYFS